MNQEPMLASGLMQQHATLPSEATKTTSLTGSYSPKQLRSKA